MSASGQKQTYAVQQPMSALPPIATKKADLLNASRPAALADMEPYSPTRVFYWRRKAASKAALHRAETERLAAVRHPRILP